MIYLDNNATTPILPKVVQAMLLDLDGIPRNPSSVTFYGRDGREKIIESRKSIAKYFGVLPEEVYFTSGGTESNHMLIQGFYKRKGGSIVSSPLEHPSVLEALKPYHPSFILPSLASIEEALLQKKPSMLVLSGANTETGVMLPLKEVSHLCEQYKVPLIMDGVGLLGKVSLSPLPKGVAAISFSGHKCHGPKGIGLAIIRKEYKIPPIFRGGHQERDMRAGTENLSGILGLAKAISLIDPTTFIQMQNLRDDFEKRLLTQFPHFQINGTNPRLPNTSNIYFQGICAETLLIKLDQKGVIASLGSACSSGTLAPSHVLLAMGYTKDRALSSLRFSLSRLTTQSDIDKSLAIIVSSL